MHALSNEECGIREVWAANLEDEMKIIRTIVQHYPYIAMDTEFPGVVARPMGQFLTNTEHLYQIMRVNIHLLKLIQLGLTFMGADGQKPPGYSTWQFNFKFNLNEDMYADDSIKLLLKSGIQFNKHQEEGIDATDFAVLLMCSGVVLSDNIHWLSFHSGYDFGYLLRILTGAQLPVQVDEFFELLKIFFPRIYDLKYLMKSTKDLKGGLQEVASMLELVRKGPQHQAGSDSLLTGEAFFKMRKVFFEDNIEETLYSGFIYGLKVKDRSGMTITGLAALNCIEPFEKNKNLDDNDDDEDEDDDHEKCKLAQLNGMVNGIKETNGKTFNGTVADEDSEKEENLG